MKRIILLASIFVSFQCNTMVLYGYAEDPFAPRIKKNVQWHEGTASQRVERRWNAILSSVNDRKRIGKSNAALIVGFIESAYNIEVPDWWKKNLSRAQYAEAKGIHFPEGVYVGDIDVSQLWQHKRDYLLSGLDDVKVDLSRQEVSLWVDTFKLNLSSSILKKCDDIGISRVVTNTGYGTAFVGVRDHGTMYVALCGDAPYFVTGPTSIISLDLDEVKENWISRLKNNVLLSHVNKGPLNRGAFTSISCSTEFVSVFGITGEEFYINVLDKKTGKLIHSFTTQLSTQRRPKFEGP